MSSVYIHSGTFHRCSSPLQVTVMLEAGGAGTYTQRAIPGSEPSQNSCTFRLLTDRAIGDARGRLILAWRWRVA